MGKNKRKSDEQGRNKNWLLRIVLIMFGSIFVILGAAGLKNGVEWLPKFHPRTGTIGFDNSRHYIMLGVIFVLIGVVPWNWLFQRFGNPKR